MKEECDIIDICCWGKMFWFDKNDKRVLFMDNRILEKWSIKQRQSFEVSPQLICDFRDIPYGDWTFKIVVMDPPHLLKLWDSSWMCKKYWKLNKEWRSDLIMWFNEWMRILEKRWILIFKRNDYDIPLSEIINLFPVKPSIWQRTWKNNRTARLIYMK